VRERLEIELIVRAARIAGGILPLARTLGVSLDELQAWAQAGVPLPEDHFFRLLDIIAEDALREPAQRSSS
jgi:DNA-binding transcriptional regulator YiaG